MTLIRLPHHWEDVRRITATTNFEVGILFSIKIECIPWYERRLLSPFLVGVDKSTLLICIDMRSDFFAFAHTFPQALLKTKVLKSTRGILPIVYT